MWRREGSRTRCPRGMRPRSGSCRQWRGHLPGQPVDLPVPAVDAARLGVPGRGTRRQLVLGVTAGCACVCRAGVDGGPAFTVIAPGEAGTSTVHGTRDKPGSWFSSDESRYTRKLPLAGSSRYLSMQSFKETLKHQQTQLHMCPTSLRHKRPLRCTHLTVGWPSLNQLVKNSRSNCTCVLFFYFFSERP